MLKHVAILTGMAALLAAQTRLSIQQQVALSQQSTPGWVLSVAPGGLDVVPVAFPRVVLGSPAAPGCVVQPGGTYLLPVVPSGIAVYRNGLRASMSGEFTLAGSVLTLAAPIPGEVVLCDYTY